MIDREMVLSVENQIVAAVDRTALLALRGQQLEGAPELGWQSFFCDLWRELQGPGLMRVVENNRSGNRNSEQLELRGAAGAVVVGRGVAKELLEQAQSGSAEVGAIVLVDGMLCLQREKMRRVIAVESELLLPQSDWIDLVVLALQWAAWQGASPERLRAALVECCMEGRAQKEFYRFGPLRFYTGEAHRSLADLSRTLRWGSGPALVVCGGEVDSVDAATAELLEAREATVIDLTAGEKSRSTVWGKIPHFAANSMAEALTRVYQLVDDEQEVIAALALGIDDNEAAERSAAWKEEVCSG